MRKRLQLIFVVKLSESMHGQIALELCHWICQVAVGCGTRFDTCYIYDCKYQSLPLSTANVGRLPHRRASLAYNAAITPTSSLSSWVATERTIMRFELLFRRHYVTTRDDVFVSPWTNVSVPSFGSELGRLKTRDLTSRDLTTRHQIKQRCQSTVKQRGAPSVRRTTVKNSKPLAEYEVETSRSCGWGPVVASIAIKHCFVVRL